MRAGWEPVAGTGGSIGRTGNPATGVAGGTGDDDGAGPREGRSTSANEEGSDRVDPPAADPPASAGGEFLASQGAGAWFGSRPIRCGRLPVRGEGSIRGAGSTRAAEVGNPIGETGGMAVAGLGIGGLRAGAGGAGGGAGTEGAAGPETGGRNVLGG